MILYALLGSSQTMGENQKEREVYLLEENNKKDPKKSMGNKKPLIVLLVLALLFTFLFQSVIERATRPQQTMIPYSEFIDMLENGEIQKAPKAISS